MAMSDNIERYYIALGLRPGASPDEVRQAYRDLVKVWHPDRFSDDRLKQKAEEKLKEINEAYNSLKHARPSQPKDSSTTRRADQRPRGAARPRQAPPHGAEEPSPPSKKKLWPVKKRELLAAVFAAAFLISVIYYVTEPAGPFLHVSFDQEVYRGTPPGANGTETGDEAEQHDSGAQAPKWTERVVSEMRIALPPSFRFNYFTIGSTRDEVQAIQGTPDQVVGETFHYGTSQVHFQGGRVVSWANNYPRLKVHWKGASTTKTGYSVGSSKDEVIAIQGTPERLTDTVFHYGTSEVRFHDGRVVGWINKFPRLKVEMRPTTTTTKDRFTVGSTRDEVLAIQGTPDSFTDNAFRYGTSEVLFQNGLVVRWTNSFPRLKIERAPDG